MGEASAFEGSIIYGMHSHPLLPSNHPCPFALLCRGEKGAKSKGPTLSPHLLVPYTPKLRAYHETRILRDIKEALCTISPLPSEDSDEEDDEEEKAEVEPYVLPDGTPVTATPPISTAAGRSTIHLSESVCQPWLGAPWLGSCCLALPSV